MNGFADYQKNSEDKDFCGVMSMFSEENVPIISTLAKEYAIMDRFFASIPGPTFPNRLMCLSGTTGGDTATTVYKNGFPHLYSQKTIFDSFEEAGHDWSLYFHDLPWEVILDRLLLPKNLGKIHRMHRFYDDVEKGSLPAFSWINPRTFINVRLSLYMSFYSSSLTFNMFQKSHFKTSTNMRRSRPERVRTINILIMMFDLVRR
jgi:phospholipase C